MGEGGRGGEGGEKYVISFRAAHYDDYHARKNGM